MKSKFLKLLPDGNYYDNGQNQKLLTINRKQYKFWQGEDRFGGT